MACDLQGTIDDRIKLKRDTKIYYVPANPLIYGEGDFLLGLAGSSEACIEVADFFRYPDSYMKPPRIPANSMVGVVLTDKGHIFQFNTPSKWIPIREKYYAIGSGAATALGALFVGASPRDAVKAAMKVDPYTGMGTKVLKF